MNIGFIGLGDMGSRVRRARPAWRSSKTMTKLAASFVAMLGLVGCQPDRAEVIVNLSDIKSALIGQASVASYRVEYSVFGALDANARSQIEQMKAIAKQFMSIDDIQVTEKQTGWSLKLEGTVPLVLAEQPVKGAAIAVRIRPNKFGALSSYSHIVGLDAGDKWPAMEAAFKRVNFMLAPEKFIKHSLRLQVRGEAADILVPAVSIDGKSHPIHAQSVNQNITFDFGSDFYTKAFSEIYFKIK